MQKRCGHVAGKQLISLEEYVGKIKAADDVRKEMDPNFLLIARTDARGAYGGGIEEAVRRGNASREAGADVVFVEGPTSEEEIRTFCSEINAPILYNYTGISPYLTMEELEEIGVSLVILPGALTRVTIQSVYDFALQLKQEGVTFASSWLKEFQKEHPLGNLHEFSGFPEIKEKEKKYLPEEESGKYDGTIGYKP